jgi:hypothetical protein
MIQMRPGILPRFHKPLEPACPVHLKRVCGVCKNFEGDLYDRGDCDLMGLNVSGRRNAHACPNWERRSATSVD